MSRRRFIKIFAAVIFVLALCAAVFCATAQAQTKTLRSPLGNLVAGIQQRADPLVYISEQDWDVNVFVIGRNVSILNAETFLAANPFVAFEPIEEIAVDEFFTMLENRDARWTELRNYLEANLNSLRVFKVKNIRREVYAVGLFQGRIIGIRTFAIET